MEYLHYIYEFISNPILDVLMGLAGLILVSGIFLLYQMALAKAFCAKMTDIEVFGFKYSRNSAGKWEYRGHRVNIPETVQASGNTGDTGSSLPSQESPPLI